MQLVRIVKIVLLVLILQQILIGVRYIVLVTMLIEEKARLELMEQQVKLQLLMYSMMVSMLT